MTPQEEKEALKAMAASAGWKLLDDAMLRLETRIERDIVDSLAPEEIPGARRELRGIRQGRITLAALLKKS